MSPSVSFPITIGTGAIQDSNMPYNNAMGAVTLVPPYSDELNKTAPKSEAAIPLMPNGYHHPGPVAPMMPPYMPNPTAPYANNAGVLPPVLPSAPMNSDRKSYKKIRLICALRIYFFFQYLLHSMKQ